MFKRKQKKSSDERARVFISYSRKDLAAAQALRDALIEAGFDAFLDQHDIAPGEPWKERLAGLIQSAEKVVYLISPASVASEICSWEVDTAEAQGKSVLPIVIQELAVDDIPGRLRRLNFVFQRSDAERSETLPNLIAALSTDLAWEREKTRINDLAKTWDNDGRPRRRLLNSDDALRAAERWRDGHPETSPPPTELQLQFIAASRARWTRRQRATVSVALLVAAATGALAVFALAQREEAVIQKQAAVASQEQAEAERDRAEARRREAQISSSRFLAREADRVLSTGDAALAAQIALEALPDPDGDAARPLVGDAVAVLGRARSALRRSAVRSLGYDVLSKIWMESGHGRLFGIRSGILASYGDDADPRTAPGLSIWRLADLTLELHVPSEGGVRFLSAQTHPDGEHVVALESNGEFRSHALDGSGSKTLLSLGFDGLSHGEEYWFEDGDDGEPVFLVVAASSNRLLAWKTNADKPSIDIEAKLGSVDGLAFEAFKTKIKLFDEGSGRFLGEWSLESGKKLDFGGDSGYRFLEVSGDEQYLAVSFDFVVRYTKNSADDSSDQYFKFGSGARRIEFAPDDDHLLVWLDSGDVILQRISDPNDSFVIAKSGEFDVNELNGFVKFSSDRRRGEDVVDIAISKNRKRLALAQANRLEIWDLERREKLRSIDRIPLLGHVAFTPDGRSVMTAPSEQIALRLFAGMGGRYREDSFARFLSIWPVAEQPDIRVKVRLGSVFNLPGRLLDDPARQIGFLARPDGFDVLDFVGDRVGDPVDVRAPVTRIAWSREGDALLAFSADEIVAAWSYDDLEPLEVTSELTPQTEPPGWEVIEKIKDSAVSQDFGSTRLRDFVETRVLEDQIKKAYLSADGQTLTTLHGKGARVWRKGIDGPVAFVEGHFEAAHPAAEPGAVFLAESERLVRVRYPIDIAAAVASLRKDSQRCLTVSERRALFQPDEPPDWCIEQRVYPYDSAAWRSWRAADGEEPMPLKTCRDLSCNR